MALKTPIDDRIDDCRAESASDGASREGETGRGGKKSVGRSELNSGDEKGERAGCTDSTQDGEDDLRGSP